MNKGQKEILQECEIAGITKDLAEFRAYDNQLFSYELRKESGLIHGFEFCGDVEVMANMRVESLVALEGLTYFKHSVVLDEKFIGSQTVYFAEERINKLKGRIEMITANQADKLAGYIKNHNDGLDEARENTEALSNMYKQLSDNLNKIQENTLRQAKDFSKSPLVDLPESKRRLIELKQMIESVRPEYLDASKSSVLRNLELIKIHVQKIIDMLSDTGLSETGRV